jgi:hypothetical protein
VGLPLDAAPSAELDERHRDVDGELADPDEELAPDDADHAGSRVARRA